MALTATIDITKSPIELKVTSDKRVLEVGVRANGETATGTAVFPVIIEEPGGRTWTKKSDDNSVAIYTS